MTATLYRKYRPQTFAEVIGQEHIKRTLQNEIASGQVAHAYLFCGIRGVGKTTLARILAKALNCETRKKGEFEPCGQCESCLGISSGRSLDLLEMDAASNRRIDDIREVKEHVPYGPVTSHYKVIIIDEVHMLTTEAFNALLKTLEEPPEHTIFVLATTEAHKLPETIVSRCQRFDFHRIPVEILSKRLEHILELEGVKADQEVLGEIARLSGGSTRDAESMLGKLVALGEKKITKKEAGLVLPHSDIYIALELVTCMIERQAEPAIKKINDFFEEGGNLSYLHQQVTELFRKLLLIKLSGNLDRYSSFDLTAEQQQQIASLAGQVTNFRVQQILEQWIKVPEMWKYTDIEQLPLELAVAGIVNDNVTADNFAANKLTPAAPLVNKPSLSSLPIKPKVESSGGVNLEQVKEKWSAVIDKLKVYNHSLSFILSVSQPISVEKGSLLVSFDYQLHKERVSSEKVRQIIENALQEVLGTPLKFRATVKNGGSGSGSLLANVLSTFGGQLD